MVIIRWGSGHVIRSVSTHGVLFETGIVGYGMYYHLLQRLRIAICPWGRTRE